MTGLPTAILSALVRRFNTPTDVRKATYGLQALLAREREFDPATRSVFWRAHIAACRDWYTRQTNLLMQAPDQDEPDQAFFRMSHAKYLAGSDKTARLALELELILFRIEKYVSSGHYDLAHDDPYCQRAVAFSNVLDYARSIDYRGCSDEWTATVYERSLPALKLQVAYSEIKYGDHYDSLTATQPSVLITLSAQERMRLGGAATAYASVRGENYLDGLRRLPPFMSMLVNELNGLAEGWKQGGSMQVRVTERKREHMLRILADHIHMAELFMQGKWLWDPRRQWNMAPTETSSMITEERALIERLTGVKIR